MNTEGIVMTDYVRRVSAWITQEQSDKIRLSGQSDSDFIREAIDEKDYQFGEMKRRIENHIIDDLIQHLSDKKDKNCQTSCQTNRSENDEIVRQLYSEMGTCQTNLSDKKGEIVRQTPEEVFGERLPVIANLLKLHGEIPIAQRKVISNKMNISPKKLQDLVIEYHDELMEMPTGQLTE